MKRVGCSLCLERFIDSWVYWRETSWTGKDTHRDRERGRERGVAEVIRRVIGLIEESGSSPRAFNSPSSSRSLKIDRLCSLLNLFNCSYGNTLG